VLCARAALYWVHGAVVVDRQPPFVRAGAIAACVGAARALFAIKGVGYWLDRYMLLLRRQRRRRGRKLHRRSCGNFDSILWALIVLCCVAAIACFMNARARTIRIACLRALVFGCAIW